MVLLDFSKAFDKVPRNRILAKLNNYGITRHLHTWICHFLTNRTHKVILDGIESDEVGVVVSSSVS